MGLRLEINLKGASSETIKELKSLIEKHKLEWDTYKFIGWFRGPNIGFSTKKGF
jgi:hypothetical protein